MNQELLAGVGNIYSDEILFQAGIHPKTPPNKLDEKRMRRLFRTMHRRNWLLRHREPDGRCPHCGGKVKRLKVSGRTAYCCEHCQK